MPDAELHSLDPEAQRALCAAAIAGDRLALERLLASHHSLLLTYARRKVGVDWRGKIEAEDVLQEAYADAFAGIGGFEYRGEDSFYRWVRNIIERRFVDQMRAWRTRKRDAAREVRAGGARQDSFHDLLERCLADVPTASVLAQRADAAGALMACIAQLPEHYREVIQRVFLNQEPLAAVAADLQRSEDAARRIGARALERLRECLGRASRYLESR